MPSEDPGGTAVSTTEQPPPKAPAQLPPEIARIVRPIGVVWRILVAILVFNVCAALLIDRAKSQHRSPAREYRPGLPNYPDHARAEAMYAELRDSWTYRPVVIEGWRRRAHRGRFIHIDERGRRYDPAATASTQHVVHFFGGSTMWGTGVEDDGTIPAQFARRHAEWAARNEGESGWVSRQSIDRLVNLLNQDEVPDAAVFYDGANDVMYLCNGSLSLNGHMRELDERDAPQNQSGHQMLRSIFEPEIWLWNAVRRPRKEHDTAAPDRCATRTGQEAVARTLLNNWSIAHDLMAARGRPFLGVLQPIAYVGRPRVEYLRALPEEIGIGGRNLNDFDRRYYTNVYAILRQWIAERHVPWMLDATDAYDTHDPIYVDYCHVSANGNAVMAARIDDALTPLLSESTR